MEHHIRKIILVIITLVVLSAAEGVSAEKVTKSQQGETSKREVVRRVAHQWVQVGQEQYKRGYYEQARRSYLMAMDYQDYLTDAEKEKINKLLEETKAAAPERKRILERIRQANGLVEQGELVKAKSSLQEVADSKFLNEQEKKQIVAGIGQIESQLNEGKKEVMGIYNSSVEYFKSGQLENAREGFLKVAGNNLIEAPAGRTPEDYLTEIDGMLMRRAEQQMSQETSAPPETEMVQKPNVKVSVTKLPPEDIKPEPNTVQTIQKGGEISTQSGPPKPEAKIVRVKAAQKQKSAGLVAVAEPGTGKNREAEKTDRRKNIIRGYVKAVVGNALSKAQNCIGGGDFARAQEIIDAAVRTVGENRSNLGDELFKQYSGQLEQLRDRMTKEKAKWLGT